MTASLPLRRRCRRASAAAGAHGGVADAQLLPRPDQLRPGRVLAVAGGGAPHGLQISFVAPPLAAAIASCGLGPGDTTTLCVTGGSRPRRRERKERAGGDLQGGKALA